MHIKNVNTTRMTSTIFAKQVLTTIGWQNDVVITVDSNGLITNISEGMHSQVDHTVGILLPALSNVHSHSFQRAMAGLAEERGPNPIDDFWTWRKVMYRFLEILTPEDIEAIAAQVQMEVLEAGFASIGEFHYVHHGQGGEKYERIDELSQRHFQAAINTGIGYTHLPVLYMRGGLDNRKLKGVQLRLGNTIEEFEALHSAMSESYKSLPNDFTLGIAPHSLRAVNKDGLLASKRVVGNGPIHIHIAEQLAEVHEVQASYGERPVKWLLDNIAIDDQWCLIHATHMDRMELTDMAKSGAVAGLCPLTEANLGDGIFNAKDYMQNGGAIGIGSDSNIRISLAEELRVLETSQRLRDKRRVILTDEYTRSNGRYIYENAATGGAKAIDRNSGHIEIGALADLVALDDTHHNIAALKEDTILDAWIFSSSDDIVCDVWSAGRHVVKDGKHIHHDSITDTFSKSIIKLRNAL